MFNAAIDNKATERALMTSPATKVESRNREEKAVDDLVQVWVPKEHLAAVYALVARLEAERVENGEHVGGEAAVTTEDIDVGGMAAVELRDRVWSEKPELLKRLYLESKFGMLRVLNYLADNTHRWVPTSELHAAIEPGRTSKSSPFGPFGRRVGGRYNMPMWPFAADSSVLTDQPGLAYRMGEQVAKQINSYRKDV